MTALSRRLREAVIVIPERELQRLDSAIDKLANRKPTVAEQLVRTRLSYALPVADAARDRFDEQLAKAGIELESRQENMRRVLAMCVLVARFGRVPGRRTQPSLAGDSAAALAAVIAQRDGRQPVHPDLNTWARHWLGIVSNHLRTAGRLPQPPVFKPEIPAVEDTLTATQAVTAALDALVPQLISYAGDLAEWSAELDPAQVTGQAEQLDLLWWLTSARPTLTAAEAAARAARDLVGMSRRIPGPPSSDQLLARWLKPWSAEQVRIGDVAALLDGGLPSGLEDLCPLTSGDITLSDRELPACQAAEWLYEELMLARLVGGAT
jgi:hypothetical protein